MDHLFDDITCYPGEDVAAAATACTATAGCAGFNIDSTALQYCLKSNPTTDALSLTDSLGMCFYLSGECCCLKGLCMPR